MGLESDIVEISSDEEDCVRRKRVDVTFDWINEFLDLVDEETEALDDVAVLEELSAPVVLQKEVSASLRPKGSTLQVDSDDDCLVLDADPDNQVTFGDRRDGGDGSDDLLIVGEKGQLACRDYPHPRHVCANFPFSTTMHEKHCHLCHCYVCDSPAPCINWSNGFPSVDHCHSTHKEGKWRALRKSIKQRNTEAVQPQKPPNTNLFMVPPLQNPISIHHPTPISLPTLSSKSSTLRPCPATGAAIRNSRIQGVHPRSTAVTCHAQRLSQHPTRSQAFIPGRQWIQSEKRGADAFAAHSTQSNAKLRRVGAAGNATWPHHGIIPNNNGVPKVVPQRPEWPPAMLVEEDMKRWQDILHGVAPERGVSDSMNMSIASVQLRAYASQNADFDTATTALNTAGYGWAEDRQLVNEQPSDPAQVSEEIHLESFLTYVKQRPLPEGGEEPAAPELDPATPLYDFDSTWIPRA